MVRNIDRNKDKNGNSENGGTPYFNLDAEKAFFEEVDEEVRNERFKQLLNKYGVYIMAMLIIALSFAVGYEKVGEWKVSRAEKRNAQYIQALSPNTEYENNIAELEMIVSTEKGIYKDVARLQIANILLDNEQKERALVVLNDIYKDVNVAEKFRDIAAIKLATYKIDSAPYAEIEALLSPIAQKNGAWSTEAKEFLAMSAIQNGDFAKGKAIYEELLTNSDISDEFRARINDMLASINEVQ